MCASPCHGAVAHKLWFMRAEQVLTALEGAVYAHTVLSCNGEALLSLDTFLEGSFWTLCLPRQCGGLIVGTADKLVDVFDKGVPLYQAFQDSSIAGEACWVAQST